MPDIINTLCVKCRGLTPLMTPLLLFEGVTERVVIVMAFNLESLVWPETVRMNLGGQIMFVDAFEGNFVLPPFMLPADVTYDPAMRRMDISQVPAEADCVQAIFSTENGKNWNIWMEDATSFDLPFAPADGDRADHASFVSVDLAGTVTYQDLVEFNDTNLADLVMLVDAFSFQEL